MRIQLSDHFTYGRLFRFVMPSIIMMIFTSIYGVVDGLFISNYAGKTSLAAINLIMPLLMIIAALGFMVGSGGSALVAKTLGEGKKEKANQYFSMLIYSVFGAGIILTVIGQVFLRPIAQVLGAEGEMLENCVLYGRIILTAITAFMLQNMFQSFLVLAEKAKLGLGIIIAAGLTNFVLDFLFIAVFKWGLAGAALATAAGELVGGIIPIIYFSRENNSLLRLTKAKFDGRALLKACTNGSSELMTNISASVVTIVYNFQLMKIAGEDGIAAYGAIMYTNFIFAAIFFGYSIGSAPIIGYHYGAENHSELKNLFRKSLIIVGVSGILLTLTAFLISAPLTKVFVGYDKELYDLTLHGFRLYVPAFLICGINIFGSAFFTALNNGAVSAVISFLRTLVFQIAVVLILPNFIGIDGVWLSIIVAELLALVITVIFFITKRKKYHYA